MAAVVGLKAMNSLANSTRCQMSLCVVGAFLGCLLSAHARSQEMSGKGARYTFDEQDRVVAMAYFGSSGLRQAAPRDVSHVKQVEITYGTVLTAEDVAFLSSLESIDHLSIGGNLSDEFVEIEGGLAPLEKLRCLEYVFLCKREMRDSDLGFVAKLPRIQHLEFLGGPNPWHEEGPAVTDACADSIRRAKTLRRLCIYRGGRLSDRFISAISQDLNDLEHLSIDSELLTDLSLQLLAERCRNLQSLDLQSDHFTDGGVAALANAKELEVLWLRSASLTHKCIQSVSGLTKLRHLELTVPTIADHGVQVLASLPALEILALRQPPLADEQFARLSHHPSLQSAFLNGRDLSESVVIDVIKTIPTLEHLGVGAQNKTLQIAVNQFLGKRKRTSGQGQLRSDG